MAERTVNCGMAPRKTLLNHHSSFCSRVQVRTCSSWSWINAIGCGLLGRGRRYLGRRSNKSRIRRDVTARSAEIPRLRLGMTVVCAMDSLPRVRGAEAGFREAQASRRRTDSRLRARGFAGLGAEKTRVLARITPARPHPNCDLSIRCCGSLGLSLGDWKVRPNPLSQKTQPNEHPPECPTDLRPSNRDGPRHR